MDPVADFVVIERAPTTALAEELQSLLKAEGIEAFLDPYSAEETVAGELYKEFTGIDVSVRRADESRARGVLSEAHRAGQLLKDLEDPNQAAEFESGADAP